MGRVKDGDSVIFEITLSYYPTWDYSGKEKITIVGKYYKSENC